MCVLPVVIICAGNDVRADEMTVATYLKLEQAAIDQKKGSPVANFYLAAVLDAYSIVNGELEEDKKPLLYCQPENLGLSALNLRQLVHNELKEARTAVSESDWEVYSQVMNIAFVSLRALQKTFPCKK
jgi:hypothetical protein